MSISSVNKLIPIGIALFGYSKMGKKSFMGMKEKVPPKEVWGWDFIPRPQRLRPQKLFF
jgi:hypothetical protein